LKPSARLLIRVQEEISKLLFLNFLSKSKKKRFITLNIQTYTAPFS
jgi:hypothetical protein